MDRREGTWTWRPHGTPTPLLVHTRDGDAVVRVAGDEHAVAGGDTLLWAAGARQDFGCDAPWEIVWAHFRPREHWDDLLRWQGLGGGVGRIPAPPSRPRGRIQAALIDMDRSAHSGSRRAADFALNALERALLWLDGRQPRPAAAR